MQSPAILTLKIRKKDQGGGRANSRPSSIKAKRVIGDPSIARPEAPRQGAGFFLGDDQFKPMHKKRAKGR
jgi:hypothetical protein